MASVRMTIAQLCTLIWCRRLIKRIKDVSGSSDHILSLDEDRLTIAIQVHTPVDRITSRRWYGMRLWTSLASADGEIHTLGAAGRTRIDCKDWNLIRMAIRERKLKYGGQTEISPAAICSAVNYRPDELSGTVFRLVESELQIACAVSIGRMLRRIVMSVNFCRCPRH